MTGGRERLRAAVVATHSRPTELARCVSLIGHQVRTVVVVDNASEPPVNYDELALGSAVPMRRLIIVRDEEQPPNLSRLWNVGLDRVEKIVQVAGCEAWDVAVLNDDAVPPSGWFDQVTEVMRAHGAAAACTDPLDRIRAPILQVRPDGDIYARMCGWAFVLRGELGLRLDETFRWWWGDTDLDWRARGLGGTVIAPGYPVGNTRANSTTVGELAAQAGRDGEAFARKWGWRPW